MKESTPVRWWDPPAVLILFAALAIAARRLFITQWTDHLDLVGIVTALGVLAGLAVGQSIASPRQAGALALCYGLFAVFWQLGLTLEGDMVWAERLGDLASRIATGFGQMMRREAVPDPLIFLFVVTALSWVLSVHAGYALTRHGRAWRAIIPTGVAMLVIQTYDSFVPARIWLLALYVFLALLLLARLAYRRRCIHWQEVRASLPPYLGLDLIRVIMVPTALLILLAWTMPVMASVMPRVERAWDLITQPWDSVLDFFSNVVVSLGGESSGRGGSYYDEEMPLGRGGVLGDSPVMVVHVPPGLRSPRYYWRARTYDFYTGGQWLSTLSTRRPVNPSYSDLVFPEAEGRLVATFVFTPDVGIATFYVAPQPVWISRPAQADLAYNSDGTADVAALHASPRLRAGQTYQVQSSVSTATAAQLRVAGTDYPQWITERYLQLPPSITSRTRELAREIGADLDNPYDIAVAVTSYLRSQIPYADTTPSPAAGQEPLDWFLFELRQGFCNYYASAEIVLLRSLGIPARLAIGFAQGTPVEGNLYRVRQLDAHAWPEVYFPGYGWIEFEPTASQPPLSRPSGEERGDTAGSTIPGEGGTGENASLQERLEELLMISGEDVFSGPAAAAPRSGTMTVPRILFLAVAVIAVVITWRVYRRSGALPFPVLLEKWLHRLDVKPPAPLHLWALWTKLPPLGRAYLEFNQTLVWLGAPPDSCETPAERAATLTRLLPAAADPARELLAEYQATTYSLRPGSAQVARTASRAIRNLSWRPGLRMRVERAIRPLLAFARRLVSPLR